MKFIGIVTVISVFAVFSSSAFAAEFGAKDLITAKSCDIFPEYGGPVGGIIGVSVIAKSDSNLHGGTAVSSVFRGPEDAFRELQHFIELGLCRETQIENLAKDCGIEPIYGMMGEFLGFDITRESFPLTSRPTIDSTLKELKNLKNLGLCKK